MLALRPDDLRTHAGVSSTVGVIAKSPPMPIRKLNSVTERAGVNYIRGVVEANNSVFKEQDLRHDYGHDAFVLLVEGEQVLSKEIAMQIKSGASYCTPTTCKIPATGGQLTFWAGHDMDTLGVVHDPDEGVAYWVDLKIEARHRTRGRREQTGAVIEFPKCPLNRFDVRMFREFLVPTLQGKVPLIDLQTALTWARSDDLDTHDLGARILTVRHYVEPDAWATMLDIFRQREPETVTPRIAIAFAKMMGHPDDGYSMEKAPPELRADIRQKILQFGSEEIAKLLFYVDDSGFERPSTGYSLMSVLGARSDCTIIFANIRDDFRFNTEIRDKAEHLLAIDNYDPHFFWHWHKDR